jgi:hypothetical protein
MAIGQEIYQKGGHPTGNPTNGGMNEDENGPTDAVDADYTVHDEDKRKK